jgi:hypothetical protein
MNPFYFNYQSRIENIQGPQGLIGSRGFPGSQGPQGAQGTTGIIGITGNKGHTGSQGSQGSTGNIGISGPKGITGSTGTYEFPIGKYFGDMLNYNFNTLAKTISNDSVYLGKNAGINSQPVNGIGIGKESGFVLQQNNSIAIGYQAGFTAQGENSIAIGNQAGLSGLGKNSIAIGNMSGQINQAEESILIDATGLKSTNPKTSGFFILPVRQNKDISYNLYYNTFTKEILSTRKGLRGSIRIETSGTYYVPADVKIVYLSAVGGGGAGGNRNTTTGGCGGGGSGGAIYQYPIIIYDNEFRVVIGQGGTGITPNGNGGNGQTTTVAFNIENGVESIIRCGGGGGGQSSTFGGAGGSVSFDDSDIVNANLNISPNANTTVPFVSPNGLQISAGRSGFLIFPFILGSSGGSGSSPGSFNGGVGGDSYGYEGGSISNLTESNGGGGAASIFSNGGIGGTTTYSVGFATSKFGRDADDGIYGSGGGGGAFIGSKPQKYGGDGGNGLVLIEWFIC